jgi:hypothetical protein
MKKRPNKSIPRNASAIPAKSRTSGSMKHRAEPRKGAKNDQPSLLAEAELIDDAHCFGAQSIHGDGQDCVMSGGKLACNCSCPDCWMARTRAASDDTECDA